MSLYPSHLHQNAGVQREQTQTPVSLETADDDGDCDDLPFGFYAQGQWVATYYDELFYIGQVYNPQSAVVKYLEQSKGKTDLFKWPKVEDTAQTDAYYVFEWDFEVQPVSSDCDVWKVPAVYAIQDKYS